MDGRTGLLRARRGFIAMLLIPLGFGIATVHQAQAAAQRDARSGSLASSSTPPVTTSDLSLPRYHERVFTQVEVTRDVVYRTVPDHDGRPVTLHLDVYTPANDTVRNRRAVIWLHPGGFTSGSKTEEAAYARGFAQHGYVTVAIDYRLNPNTDWFNLSQRYRSALDAIDDAGSAVSWLRDHASTYGVDPSLIFVAGYSAGAVTAFDLAYPPAGVEVPAVAGAASVAGYTYGAASSGGVPVLEVHGTNDPLIPYALGSDSCDALQAGGDRCEMVTYEGAGHDVGFTHRDQIVDRASEFFAGISAAH